MKQKLLSSTAVRAPAPKTGKAAFMEEFLRYNAADTLVYSPIARDAALYGRGFMKHYDDRSSEHVSFSDLMTPEMQEKAIELFLKGVI